MEVEQRSIDLTFFIIEREIRLVRDNETHFECIWLYPFNGSDLQERTLVEIGTHLENIYFTNMKINIIQQSQQQINT